MQESLKIIFAGKKKEQSVVETFSNVKQLPQIFQDSRFCNFFNLKKKKEERKSYIDFYNVLDELEIHYEHK